MSIIFEMDLKYYIFLIMFISANIIFCKTVRAFLYPKKKYNPSMILGKEPKIYLFSL
jgi:hypothetical protein